MLQRETALGNAYTRAVLSLASRSDPAWAERALADLDAVLLDHAHLEKKAAGMAVTLMFRYPERTALMEPLSRLAREELTHFEQVLAQLGRRGTSFRRQRASPYAGRLHRLVRAHEPARLLDTLLVAAVIEARSCERFGLLADALEQQQPELAGFYRGLLAAEARHHGIYLDLARLVASESELRERLGEITRNEAELAAGCSREPRLHG